MNKPKNLTNTYLLMLAHTDIDSQSFTEIESFLREKIDNCTEEKRTPVPEDRVKAALIEKLNNFPEVDKISLKDGRGYQISSLGFQANGAGPVTILIIGEGE